MRGYQGPSFTPEQLYQAIATSGSVDVERLEHAVGATFDTNSLELAVENEQLMTTTRLLAVKQFISGLRTTDNPGLIPVPVIPAGVARQTGAIAIDGPKPIVAFIEDTPANVELVAEAISRDDFDVWLMTASQFSTWFKKLYVSDTSDMRPAAGSIAEVFDAALSSDASDIHLTAGRPPLIRTSVGIAELKFQPLSDIWLNTEFRKIVGDDKMELLETTHNADSGYSYGDTRFRINLGHATNGMTAAVRRLPNKIPTFDDIDLPASVRAMCDLERGLVLVTGPTGSGKSTTLAAMLANIGLNQSRHIVTLEDPIEFEIPARKSIVHQRELGSSFTSFAAGLRQSLRQDPDVILVGEARDRETISAAVTAAETGALVFATLHTYDAASTLSRIVATYPEGEQDQIRASLAHVLKGIVSQTLIPSTQGGRLAAFEVLVGTPAVANNLKKVDGAAQLRQVIATGVEHGMISMEASLASLVRRGLISQTDAEFKARDVEEFRRQLGAAR